MTTRILKPRHILCYSAIALLIHFVWSSPLSAQEIDIFGTLDDPFGVGAGKLTQVMKDIFAPEDDLHLLKYAHYSEIFRWANVVPARPQKGVNYSKYPWKRGSSSSTPPRTMAIPVAKGEAWTVINIPETRSYRLWLGYLATFGKNYPVTITLSGSTSATHTYASVPLPLHSGSPPHHCQTCTRHHRSP
ncbi:MAG: hypothetical protein GX230_03705 [Lentisphaerae bacterium]|nr:hypothetical protein [Lentisphaerota bacterium]